MTIGEFERYCKKEHNIIIDNIGYETGKKYYKKSDGNWYEKIN